MGSLAKDTALLAIVHFLAGIIGFFYRVFLSNELGAEGMGIYQQALTFFRTVIILMTAGIPLSISKLMAEYDTYKNSRGSQMLSSAFVLTLIFSFIGSIILVVLALILHRRVLFYILPAAVFVGLSSVMKGFFLGTKDSAPLGWSLIAESVLRTLFGMFCVKSMFLYYLESKTRGAVCALGGGEFVSLYVLYIFFKTRQIKLSISTVNIKDIRDILNIAIPISLSQVIGSLSSSIKAFLLPKSLEISGYTASGAMALYGKTSGMVLPLLFFPSHFISSLSSNIIPRISEAVAKKNVNYAFELAEQSLVFSSLFSFAVTSLFLCLATPISQLIYRGQAVEKLIIGFAPGIPFFYIESILFSILRSTGNNITPIKISILDFFLTNILVYVLVTKPLFSVYGYSFALITASAISILICIQTLEKQFHRKFNMVNILFKPLLSMVFMSYILTKSYTAFVTLGYPAFLCIIADSLLGLCGYFCLAFALGLKFKFHP